MYTLSPIAIAFVIVVGLAIFGGIAAVLRRTTTFRSYEELTADARAIAKALKGEVFRDGADLVVSGNLNSWPAVVRFSHAETMPGVDLRMEAPAAFTLWVAPRSASASEGRALLRSSDSVFDTRFSMRSDHPTHANMLLAGKRMLTSIQKLCRTSTTHLVIAPGSIELTDEVIPRSYTTHHVLEQLTAMAALADFLKTMPGAEQFKIRPIRRDYHILGRVAIAAGVLTAILTVSAATKVPADPNTGFVTGKVPDGVLPLEGAKIPGVADYRIATQEDFDPAAAAWLRNSGARPWGRVALDFLGKGEGRDAGYVLIDNEGGRRLVLLTGGVDRYDLKMPYVALIARVPKAAVNSVQWVGRPPQDFDGDGLLIVRKRDDPASGLVLFISGTRMLTAVPANYQAISLQ